MIINLDFTSVLCMKICYFHTNNLCPNLKISKFYNIIGRIKPKIKDAEINCSNIQFLFFKCIKISSVTEKILMFLKC